MKEEQLLKDLKMLRAMFNDEVRSKDIEDLIINAIKNKNSKWTFHDHIQSKGYDMDENGDPIVIKQEEISDDDKKKLSTRTIKELGERWDDKPPIGIMPREIWDKKYKEELESKRHDEVAKAIIRYIESDKPIKQEWIDEYHDWFPKALKDFIKPEKKQIRAWLRGISCLYEVDEINKKLNRVSSGINNISDGTSGKYYDFIKKISELENGVVDEHWFLKEPGASGEEITKYIDNELLPNRKCFFFSKRSSNDHHDLEKAYFKQHDSGKE
jgi:hypothetical protein